MLLLFCSSDHVHTTLCKITTRNGFRRRQKCNAKHYSNHRRVPHNPYTANFGKIVY